MSETYGAWPKVAAAAAGPAVAAAVARRDWLAEDLRWARWLALPALWLHQTEEWVWPGGFLPETNGMFGSERPEFPLDRRLGFHVNVTMGWTLCAAAALLGRRRPALTAVALTSHAVNGAGHVALAAGRRRWNPGAVTSAAAMLPLAASGLTALRRRGHVTPAAVAAGVSSIAWIPAVLTWRTKRGPASRTPSGGGRAARARSRRSWRSPPR